LQTATATYGGTVVINSNSLVDASNNQYVTSTVQTNHYQIAAESGGAADGIDFAFTTSTILAVQAANTGSSATGTIVFNLGFTTSTANPTSTWEHIFTSDQTITSTMAQWLTVNGSSSWQKGWSLGYYTEPNSTSSEFTVSLEVQTPL
jgi:hypothetical protein